MIRRLLEYALSLLLVVLVVSLVFGHLLGQPALLAFVETGSMEPTLNAGDGFVAIPAAVAGDVETGDVVVFQSESVHGGELTTHRVVSVRDGGYVTRGDANPFTDQSRGEPPVTDGQIKAVALQVNGEVVRIPNLGTGVAALQSSMGTLEGWLGLVFDVRRLGSQELAYLLFGAGVAIYVASFRFVDGAGRDRAARRSRDRDRDGVFATKTVIAVAVGVLLVVTTLAMVLPAGTTTYDIVSSESDAPRPDVIPAGGSSELAYPVHNGGYLPVVSFLEPSSPGVELDRQRFYLGANETGNATLTLHAPPETGLYHRSVTEHRYIVVLPPSVIDGLYEVHPWLPYLAVDTVVGTLLVALGLALSGGSDTVRTRTRPTPRARGYVEWLLPW